mmetsp:Transcript_173851/g.551970  ORF Transcript_173851/g.551970 Transcript_173851/m.551970 type:complete len:88 (-) Transcript_173851:107-370(-)
MCLRFWPLGRATFEEWQGHLACGLVVRRPGSAKHGTVQAEEESQDSGFDSSHNHSHSHSTSDDNDLHEHVMSQRSSCCVCVCVRDDV